MFCSTIWQQARTVLAQYKQTGTPNITQDTHTHTRSCAGHKQHGNDTGPKGEEIGGQRQARMGKHEELVNERDAREMEPQERWEWKLATAGSRAARRAGSGFGTV